MAEPERGIASPIADVIFGAHRGHQARPFVDAHPRHMAPRVGRVQTAHGLSGTSARPTGSVIDRFSLVSR